MPKFKLESGLVHALKDTLDLLRCHGVCESRFVHVPTGKSPQERNHAAAMSGMADLLIFLPRGVTLHVELKSATGKQMPHQKDWEEQLRKYGHHYRCINSTEEFAEELLKFGVDVTKYRWNNLPNPI